MNCILYREHLNKIAIYMTKGTKNKLKKKSGFPNLISMTVTILQISVIIYFVYDYHICTSNYDNKFHKKPFY